MRTTSNAPTFRPSLADASQAGLVCLVLLAVCSAKADAQDVAFYTWADAMIVDHKGLSGRDLDLAGETLPFEEMRVNGEPYWRPFDALFQVNYRGPRLLYGPIQADARIDGIGMFSNEDGYLVVAFVAWQFAGEQFYGDYAIIDAGGLFEGATDTGEVGILIPKQWADAYFLAMQESGFGANWNWAFVSDTIR
jgi:hypothetical protein